MKITLSYDRMMSYLPVYWHTYLEMQELLKAYSIEIDSLNEEQAYLLIDAFVMEMRKERIEEWEKWLKLPPNGSLHDRRLAVLNYFFRGVKMSRESIQATVAQMYNGARCTVKFYGGANQDGSWLWNNIRSFGSWEKTRNEVDTWGGFAQYPSSTIWITIKPLPEQEDEFIGAWQDVKNDFATWQEFQEFQQNGWSLYGPYKELYDYLWPRKPSHIHLIIDRYQSAWRDTFVAGSWGAVNNSAKNWGSLNFKVWE